MKRDDAGLTLVEVLVALFLLAIGVLGVAPMFVYAMHDTATGAELGSVGAIATRRMELLRSADYDSLVAGGSLNADVVGYSDGSDPDYTVRWLIADNLTPSDTKTIALRVAALRELPGPRREVSLVTLRAE